VKAVQSPFSRITGTILFTVFLVIVLAIAVQGAFQTRASIAQTFDRQSRIEEAQVALEEMLRLQIDEENSVRGYILNRDLFYLQQYAGAVASFDRKEQVVRLALGAEHLAGALSMLQQYATLQQQWRTEVAQPMLAHPDRSMEQVDKQNKAFSDYENRTADAIRVILANTNMALARSTQTQINQTLYVRAFWLLRFCSALFVANTYRFPTAMSAVHTYLRAAI